MQRYWDAAAVRVRAWQRRRGGRSAARGAATARSVSQMMADVPLGAFLSGGIDSSSIVAFMSEASLQPVNSFSIGFDDGTYNELPYAREVAALFKTNHRERTVSPDLEELFEKLVVHLDEPFADVSLFPTYLVSQLAREHVTVALSGDGGDELFGGYDAYQAQELAARFARMGDTLHAGAGRGRGGAAADGEEEGPGQQVQALHAGRRTRRPSDLGHYRWMVYLGARAKRRLYTPALRQRLTARRLLAGPRGAGRFGAGRSAQPSALRRPVALPGRRHPREGRSHEHGHVARDARAVSRRRRHGAGVLDAGRSQDPQRRTEVDSEAGDARRPARRAS